MRVILIAVAVLNVFMQSAFAEDKYLCIGEQSTGFSCENNKCRTTNFTVDGHKFILRKANKIEKNANGFGIDMNAYIHYFEYGTDSFVFNCTKLDNGKIYCGEETLNVTISTKNNRFVSVSTADYLSEFNKGKRISDITIGTCSKI